MAETLLIVGLGNPGREYRENRHNIGFMALDRLSKKLNTRFTRLQSKSLVANTMYEERRIILAKPQTFMNLSGQAVRGLIHFYKLPLNNLLIIHDDIDLPHGTIRIRPDGGAAGQKGMVSTLEHLGTDEFPRMRLGIGHPPGQMQTKDYVLQDFSADEMTIVSGTLDRAVKAALTFIAEGLNTAMNQFNGDIL